MRIRKPESPVREETASGWASALRVDRTVFSGKKMRGKKIDADRFR